MLTFPLNEKLSGCERILLTGAGLGFDVICALPLYFALKGIGKEVFISNLSFSDLSEAEAFPEVEKLRRVTRESKGSESFFPEKHLAQWFHDHRGEDIDVYAFEPAGARPLRKALDALIAKHDLDTVIFLDGGADSLMRGDEAELGAPVEDMALIAAIRQLHVPNRMFLCLGFGLDTAHGVCHDYFLEAVSELIRAGAWYGALTLHKDMLPEKLFVEAAEYVLGKLPNTTSLVVESLIRSLRGEYGVREMEAHDKTFNIWINPLIPLLWGFDLEKVAQRILYMDLLYDTNEIMDVGMAIDFFRKDLKTLRPNKSLPV